MVTEAAERAVATHRQHPQHDCEVGVSTTVAERVEADSKHLLAMVNAGGIVCEDLREILQRSGTAIAVLNSVQTAAAATIAVVERHGDGGVHVLGTTAGIPRREARGQVKTAQSIAEAPAIRDAVESGRVSQANAKRLAEAVDKTSGAAVESDPVLLSQAERLTPEQFTKEARRWTAEHQSDHGVGDYQRLRAKRSLRVWDGDDGSIEMRGTFDPVTGKRISNRLQVQARRMYRADKKAARNGRGQGRSFQQCMADAIDQLTATSGTPMTADACSADTGASGTGALPATTETSPGTTDGRQTGGRTADTGEADTGKADAATGDAGRADTGTADVFGTGRAETDSTADTGTSTGAVTGFADISVTAHVDETTGELVAQLADGQRLPPAVLEELTCNARLTGVIFDTSGQPIWRAKPTRTATESQRRLLLKRWGGCFGCGADPSMCQSHHIVPVSQGGPTSITNMVPVCWDCHNKIHHHNWQIHTRSDGNHSLHPPGQPHHGPAHAPDQPRLFRRADNPSNPRQPHEDPRPAIAEASRPARARASGPATARAALGRDRHP